MKYYEMSKSEYESLENSYKVITGTSGSGWTSNYREFFTFLPKSQCKLINNELYIPAWLVANKNIWNSINKNIFYEIDKEGKVIKQSLKNKTCKFKQDQEIIINNSDLEEWINNNSEELKKVIYVKVNLGSQTLIKIA